MPPKSPPSRTPSRAASPTAREPASAPAPPASRWALALAALALTVLAGFAGALRNGWLLFDDPRYVYQNPWINHGLVARNMAWFLTHAHGENWHPLTSWSHMLDVTLFGLRPAGHHAVSVLLHALATVLLAWVLARLTGARWRSLIVAALFGLHPLRAESVAWISERKDVLSGVLFLLALEAYRRWVERPTRARFAALGGVHALGLMAKPMLVTTPFVLVLLDLWPLGRLRGVAARGDGDGRAPARGLGGLIAEKWPLILLSLGSAVVTFLVQRRAGAVASVAKVPPLLRVGNALLSYLRYAGKTLWPDHLAAMYPYPRTIPGLVVAGALVALLALSALAVLGARRRPYLATGWFWYLGMLIPVIGLVQVGDQALADRYTYLPGIGLLLALVWGTGELAGRSRAWRAALVAAVLLALAALVPLTVRQVTYWRDTRTLFAHALAVTGPNPVAHEEVGEGYLQEGRPDQAIPHLEEALRQIPSYPDAHSNLGMALGLMHREAEAIVHFRLALQGHETAQAHHNLGFALLQLGRVPEAIPELEAALRIDPGLELTRALLAQALARQGRAAEGREVMISSGPAGTDSVEVLRRMAALDTRSGDVERAIAEYRGVLRLSPDDLDALNNIAWIRATHADAAHRNGAEAVRCAERARDRSPQPEAVLFSTLAAAYAESGRFREAVAAGGRAVALAHAAGSAADEKAFAAQLARYRAGRPFHFGE